MSSRTGSMPSRHVAIAVSFIALAVVLGGGGTPNPGTEVVLQMVLVVAALVWIWMPAPFGGGVPAPQSKLFWIFCALVLALPVLQLLPLPPSIWTQLPGAQDRFDALALVGKQDAWEPISRYPSRTLASLLSLFVPLFAAFATASLGIRGRMWVVAAIAVMAVASALLGALQISTGGSGANIYAEHAHALNGFQANRNSTADVLLIGMVAMAACFAPSLYPSGSRPPLPKLLPGSRTAAAVALICGLFLLLFATVLTGSRAGISLIPLALLAVCLMTRPAFADFGKWRNVPAALAVAAVMAIAGFALFGGNRALERVADRFGLESSRYELWKDAWYAATNAWPFGIGVGGATQALIAVERLEVVDATRPNRVHNDYLELILEGGLPGLVLFALVVALLAYLAVRTWQRRPDDRILTLAGVAILLFAAAHSFVDYPLRSMALACLIGAGAGLLIASPQTQSIARTGDSSHD